MKNRLLGLIGILWGGFLLFNWLTGNIVQGEGAYSAGQVGAVLFGALFSIGGMYFFIRGDGREASDTW
jgi:hypothetical protein